MSSDPSVDPRPCAFCVRQFSPTPGQLRRGVGLFCSRSCAAKGRSRPTLDERFWSKVDMSGGPTACWPYTGCCDLPGGYGQVRVGGHLEKAHRVAFTLATGEIAPGEMVLHSCDNPPCCNPSHLFSTSAPGGCVVCTLPISDCCARPRSSSARDAVLTVLMPIWARSAFLNLVNCGNCCLSIK